MITTYVNYVIAEQKFEATARYPELSTFMVE